MGHPTLLDPTIVYNCTDGPVLLADLCFQRGSWFSYDGIHKFLPCREHGIARLWFYCGVFAFVASKLALDVAHRLLVFPAFLDLLQESVLLTLSFSVNFLI